MRNPDIIVAMPNADEGAISPELVANAYRFILGREPESADAIRFHMAAADFGQLRTAFLRCPEFQDSLPRLGIMPFPDFIQQAAPLDIDLCADEKSMRRLLRRVERCWTSLGETSPHWSVLVADQFKPETFDEHADEFYASGRPDVDRLFCWLARNHIAAGNLKTCLEFGCGTGRTTPWLAERFRRVIACDISPPHIELARLQVERTGCRNVEFVRTATLDALGGLSGVDLVFSVIVLQHNPPPVIGLILRRLLQSLNPGGIAFFQVPTYGTGYRFKIREYLLRPLDHGMEMHVIPQCEVFKAAEEHGCSVVEVEPDCCTGLPAWISNTFLLQKRR